LAELSAVTSQEDHVKAYRSLIVCAAALLLAGGCQASQGPSEEVVIGADLELSGADAAIGKVYAQALQLRVEQVNKEGALGNRRLTLVIRDNRSDPATSAANINALASDPSVRVLVTGSCGSCIVDSAKAVNDAKIPTISLARPTTVSTPIGDRRYIFKLAPNAEDDATALVSELSNAGPQRVSIVSQDDLFNNETAAALNSKLGKASQTLASAEKLGDPAAVASRIARLKPTPAAGVVLASSGPAGLLAKALKAEQFDGRVLYGSGAADSLFLSGDSAQAMEGASLVFTPTLVSDDVIATSPAKSGRNAWFRDYLSTYGTYNAYASFAADAVGLTVEAITQTNSTDRDALRTAMETARFDGLSGPIRITPQNHSGLMPQAVTMLVVANGRWRLAS
jgi:branched-chain amino acid transport system substrate-binding protein